MMGRVQFATQNAPFTPNGRACLAAKRIGRESVRVNSFYVEKSMLCSHLTYPTSFTADCLSGAISFPANRFASKGFCRSHIIHIVCKILR